MASIRKISHVKENGDTATYWQVSYYDSNGKRCRKNHKKQAKANAHRVKIEGELLTGSHITDKSTVSVEEACQAFLNDFERDMQAGKRERSTWKQYKGHVNNHIKPYAIAKMLLNQVQTKDCRVYLDELLDKVSGEMAAKVMSTVRMIFSFSEERGWIKGNPARSVKVRKETRKTSKIIIPEKKVVKKIIDAAEAMGSREHAFVCLGFFAGLRASELRGLPKTAVRPGNLFIDQRADEWGKIGAPKTPKGYRTIPIGAYTLKVVQKWLKEAPGSLVFASEAGTPMSYQNLYNRFWLRLHIKAELYTPATETEEEKGIIYGMHIMRHVCASLWIEQGHNPKKIQEMLGHATLAMTMDTYGHLFQSSKESRSLVNKAEKSVMGTK